MRTTFQCLHASRKTGRRTTLSEIKEQGTRVFMFMIREHARAGEPVNVAEQECRLDRYMARSVRGWYTVIRRSWPSDINWSFVEDAFIVALHGTRKADVPSTPGKSMNTLARPHDEKDTN